MNRATKTVRLLSGALCLALCLAWPAAPLAAEAAPQGKQAERWHTPLGTFELDPDVRERLEALERALTETARDLGALLEEKARLSPEQERRLRDALERLREQLRRLQKPAQEEGGPKQV